MKRVAVAVMLLLSVVAAEQVFAADMPLPSPSPPPPQAIPSFRPIYDWRGFYIGLNGGYGFGNSSWTDPNNPLATTGNFGVNGFLFGGTLGGNFQMGAFVIGPEVDLDWQSLKGSSASAFCTGLGATALPPPGSGLSCQTQSDWIGTARLRLGFAADRALFFATGGAAMGDVRTGLSTLPLLSSSGQVGWTVGGGVEIGLGEAWTAKVEYLHVNLGTVSCNVSANCGFDPGGPAVDRIRFTESIVRAGINFKFTP